MKKLSGKKTPQLGKKIFFLYQNLGIPKKPIETRTKT